MSAQVYVGGQLGVRIGNTNNKLNSASTISALRLMWDKVSAGGRIGLSFSPDDGADHNMFEV